MQLNIFLKKCGTFGFHNKKKYFIYTAGLGISKWIFCFKFKNSSIKKWISFGEP